MSSETGPVIKGEIVDAPRMNRHIEIVRELAERGPFVDPDDGIMGRCPLCGASAMRPLDEPANHEPDCTWRRAKALYP